MGTGLDTSGLKTIMENAFSTIGGDIFKFIEVALPTGLGIMGVIIAVLFGVNFFRKVARGN